MRELAVLFLHLEEPVTALTFSADSRWLMSRDDRTYDDSSLLKSDDILRLWDLSKSGQSRLVREWQLRSPTIRGVAFSPDSRWLLTGMTLTDEDFVESRFDSGTGSVDDRRSAALWKLDVGPNTEPTQLLRLVAGQNRAAFSANGRWLLAGNQLWSMAPDGRAADSIALPGSGNSIDFVGFTPDMSSAIVSTGGAAQLHSLRMENLLRSAFRTAARNLTQREWDKDFPNRPFRKTFEQLR